MADNQMPIQRFRDKQGSADYWVNAAYKAYSHAVRSLEICFDNPGDMRDRIFAIENCIVWIRSITFALQKVGEKDVSFVPWYEAERKALESDPVLRALKDLRNQILKTLESGVIKAYMVLDQARLQNWLEVSRPANAIDFHPMSIRGVPVWICKDGTGDQYEVDAYVPDGMIDYVLFLADPKTDEVLIHKDAVDVLVECLEQFRLLINRAAVKFTHLKPLSKQYKPVTRATASFGL